MGRSVRIAVNGSPFDVEVLERGRDRVTFAVSGRTYEVEFVRTAPASGTASGGDAEARRSGPSAGAPPAVTAGDGSTVVHAPIPGLVGAIKVKPGDVVETGAVLLSLEAMKMQNAIASPIGGRVAAVHVDQGQEVMDGQPLISIAAVSDPHTA